MNAQTRDFDQALDPIQGFVGRHVLRLAEDGSQFESAIAEILSSTSDTERVRLRRFAAENTWDRRAKEVMDIIGEWLESAD